MGAQSRALTLQQKLLFFLDLRFLNWFSVESYFQAILVCSELAVLQCMFR
jgi:hypothetical protein